MTEQNNTKNFDKINQLYSRYVEMNARKADSDFDAKYGVEFKSVREKIFIMISKIYFKFEITAHKEGEEIFDAVNDGNKNDDNYSDVVIEKIAEALDNYEDSTSKENGIPFSIHVCSNIKRALGSAKSQKYASANNGGSAITNHEASMIRKILKSDKELIKYGSDDEDKRNQKLAVMLATSVDVILKYKKLAKTKTISTEITTPDGNTFSPVDFDKSLQEENSDAANQDCYVKQVEKNMPELLEELNRLYSKKSEVRDSELLAITLLKPFDKLRTEEIENHDSLIKFYPDIYELLKKYECINKEILTFFFENKDYKLPTLQDIAKKYNLEKSSVTKVVTRYTEKLKENKKLTDLFEDFVNEY